MRTKDVMLKTGITRKAIEYYEKQGFFTAERDENGYRNYEPESCALLRKIRALRRLGLSVAEIKEIFEAERPEISFSKLLRDREIRRSIDEKRRDIIKRLAEGARLETLGPEIESIDAEQTIFERLCEKFPGHMGRLLFLNYRPFLGERLETDRQKRAFDEYTDFLDGMDEFVLSEEEIKFLEESSAELSMDAVEKHTEAKLAAINDTETWLKENADNIEKYKELIMSEEFRSSPAFGIKEKLKAYMENSGYYKIAIPLLRKMSPAYDEYYLRLLSADGKFRNARENTDQNI